MTCAKKKSFGELEKAQEEGDTKFILHANHYLESTQSTIIIDLLSSDTDIMVLDVVLYEYKERVMLMDNQGQIQKQIPLSSIE